jgi:hypothetical protein
VERIEFFCENIFVQKSKGEDQKKGDVIHESPWSINSYHDEAKDDLKKEFMFIKKHFDLRRIIKNPKWLK